MKRPLLFVILAAFIGSIAIDALGARLGWSALVAFLVKLVLLFGLAVIRSGVSRLFMLLYAVLQAIPVFGLTSVAIAGPIVIVTGFALLWRTYLTRFTRSELTPRHDQAIADGARGPFDEFRRLGFQPVTSADATGVDYKTIFTYLVSADRRTYAVVTDQLQTLASQFGPKELATMDRAALPTAPTELRQLVRTLDLSELVDAHERALAVLASHGHQPDHLVPDRILDISITAERNTIDLLAARPWWVLGQVLLGMIRRERPNSRPITHDPITVNRIERWSEA
ncbi:MAG TPA: hypothetical protein VFT54_08000 [Acidimicrobiia bacterium]|nr:hypothetical protein [Acidimicrobiia bacterium]